MPDFCSLGDETQDFMHDRQVRYHAIYPPDTVVFLASFIETGSAYIV